MTWHFDYHPRDNEVASLVVTRWILGFLPSEVYKQD